MGEEPSRADKSPESGKPSFRAQASKAFSQLALTFYVLLLVLALVATAGRDPRIALLMALCAVVPAALGPGVYRIVGVVALLIAGGLYLSAGPR